MKKETIYDLNKIVLSDKYYELIDNLTKEILDDYYSKNDKVKFFIKKGKIIDNFSKGNFLTYLIILEFFHKFNIKITEEYLFSVDQIKNIFEIENYFDKIIEEFHFDNDLNVKPILVNTINKINYIDCKMNRKFGPTFDLKSIIDLAEKDKEFHDILYHPEINMDENNFDAEKVIEMTNQKTKRIEEIITRENDSSLSYFIKSGSGINSKQLGQVFGLIGLKPDLREKIIPIPIDSNFAMGLRNVQSFYINAMGCLKALITSHSAIKSSGYLTRKLEIHSDDEFINKEVEDCGTNHLAPVEIKNKKYLKFLSNTWYLEDKDSEFYEKLTERDTHLVGKTIYIRTPFLCACKKGICKTCYGELYKENQNMNVGIIAVLLLTNLLSQRLLSAKHLLTAIAEVIKWSDNFLKFFDISMDRIIKKDEIEFTIVIDKDFIDTNEEKEYDEYEITKFTVIYDDKEYEIELPIIIVLNEEISENLDSYFSEEDDAYILKNKTFSSLDHIFSFDISNNGLSKALIEIKNLIEKNAFISEHDVFELFTKFITLIDESGLSINFVHISLIIKNMMKMKNDRTDFATMTEMPEYKLYNISDSIHYSSESAGKPLLFEYIKKHLTTDAYETLNKTGTSVMDILLE